MITIKAATIKGLPCGLVKPTHKTDSISNLAAWLELHLVICPRCRNTKLKVVI